MRFGRDRRVRKRAEFQDLGSRGVRVVTPHFVLIACARRADTSPAGISPAETSRADTGRADTAEARQPSRLGITASRKVGNAVERNRAKRLAREAFRALGGLLPAGHDLLVIVRHTQDLSLEGALREWEEAKPRLLRASARPRPERGSHSTRRGPNGKERPE